MNMNIAAMKTAVTSQGSRGMLVLQKHSPEIFLGVGILGTVASAVLACRATLKADKTLKETRFTATQFARIHEMDKKLGTNEYSEEDYKRDLKILTIQSVVEIGKLYAPAVILGTVSIGMLVQSRNILSRRNASLLAAYKLVDEAYNRYRDRVREEFGEDLDIYLRSEKKDPKKEFKAVVKDEKGKEQEFVLTEEEKNMVEFGASQYAKIFDESSPQWRQSNELNLYFLRAQQTNANVTLQARGHLFLSEVYDMLGIPRTPASIIVGWVKGHGDDVVDFGLLNSPNNINDDFINGYERSRILLDFNVDGVIYDII